MADYFIAIVKNALQHELKTHGTGFVVTFAKGHRGPFAHGRGLSRPRFERKTSCNQGFKFQANKKKRIQY